MSKILASVVLSSMLVSVLAEVPTVKDLKLDSYSGKWYQIADYPLFYENFCGKCTEASYTPNADGSISVQNDAQSVFGRIGICSTAGTATISDPAQPAKLKVKLDSGFGRVADYWVVEVGPEENGKYSWSIVTNAQQSLRLRRSPCYQRHPSPGWNQILL